MPERRPLSTAWGSVIRSSAFVRKELVEILRQPRLLVVMVLGPFLLLLAFGAGYSEEDGTVRAAFVGPPGSVYERALDDYASRLDDFVVDAGYGTDVDAAVRRLRAGEVDVVVVFPDDPLETILDGERAPIRVIHAEIDPIQRLSIQVAARVAVGEVNASTLSAVATQGRATLAPVADLATGLTSASAALGDTGTADAATGTAIEILDELAPLLDGSSTVVANLTAGVDDTAGTGSLDEVRAARTDLRRRLASLDEADREQLAADLGAFAGRLDQLVLVDPDVLVRPFVADTESIVATRISPEDYFTPGALALLLQHLGVTMAALSLVRDRTTGLFELLRAGPIGSGQILVGKSIAYLAVGFVAAALLVGASNVVLGVPLEGSALELAAVVAGVVLASLALGSLLSAFAGTESQAVQYAMLTLLAGLFFSGFILPVADLALPVRWIAYLLQVTYGISGGQDVMLRGTGLAAGDLAGLGALTLVYGTAAVLALHRRMRTG